MKFDNRAVEEVLHGRIKCLQQELKAAHEEIEVLRRYGNSDCTAMADEALAESRAALATGEKAAEQAMPEPAPRDARIEKLERLHKETWQQLRAFWDRLNPPSPRCRDCADCNGRCQNVGPPCDPQERALERLDKLLAAPVPEQSILTPEKEADRG